MFKNRLSDLLKHLGTVVFSKSYYSKSKECMCWGLFSAAE